MRGFLFLRIGASCFIGATALAQAPIFLDHYVCVFQEACGEVSRACWTPNHPWGGGTCGYCDGGTKQDLCQKAYNVTCWHTGNMQSCGNKYTGQCLYAGQQEVGRCVKGRPLGESCSVPMC